MKKFGRAFDLIESREYGKCGLNVLDAHLEEHQWLAAGQPTIADVASYPYVALAPEGEITLVERPNVLRWITQVQSLPGYIGTQGIANPG